MWSNCFRWAGLKSYDYKPPVTDERELKRRNDAKLHMEKLIENAEQRASELTKVITRIRNEIQQNIKDQFNYKRENNMEDDVLLETIGNSLMQDEIQALADHSLQLSIISKFKSDYSKILSSTHIKDIQDNYDYACQELGIPSGEKIADNAQKLEEQSSEMEVGLRSVVKQSLLSRSSIHGGIIVNNKQRLSGILHPAVPPPPPPSEQQQVIKLRYKALLDQHGMKLHENEMNQLQQTNKKKPQTITITSNSNSSSTTTTTTATTTIPTKQTLFSHLF